MLNLCCFYNKKKMEQSVTNCNPDFIAWKDTIEFICPITEGHVIKVYDGDTITIASKLPYDSSKLYRFTVRLKGVDTPEIKGSTKEEKEMAIEARNFLSGLILQKKVYLKNIQHEKYGRILADVYLNTDTIAINQTMLNERYAIPYDGKTKKVSFSWKHYKETGIII